MAAVTSYFIPKWRLIKGRMKCEGTDPECGLLLRFRLET